VVLVRPETPSNVGAAARALANTGLESLVLVQPGDYRTVECWRTAWGGHEILEGARVAPDLLTAVASSHRVIALSGREGFHSVDIRDAAEGLRSLPPDTVVSLVFGPETSGLTLEELALCGQIARIPSHKAQPSLNLSHAVMVAAYEVFRAATRAGVTPSALATHGQKERLLDLLTHGLEAIHALSPREGSRYMREWRALVARADLTSREIRLLEHAARKMIRAGGK
jgi:TrmH family RNA methyltransferase